MQDGKESLFWVWKAGTHERRVLGNTLTTRVRPGHLAKDCWAARSGDLEDPTTAQAEEEVCHRPEEDTLHEKRRRKRKRRIQRKVDHASLRESRGETRKRRLNVRHVDWDKNIEKEKERKKRKREEEEEETSQQRQLSHERC